jgi:hypothetical protein
MTTSRKVALLAFLALVFLVPNTSQAAKTVTYTASACPNLSTQCIMLYYERSWGTGYWNAFTDPSGFTGIMAPQYKITYQADVVNTGTGASYADGASIPVGTNITLKFPAVPPPPQVFQQYYSASGNGIAWEYANDPVQATGGRWVAGATDPRACTAASADWPVMVWQTTGGTPALNTLVNESRYFTFPFAPPALSITGISGMTCGALVGNTMACSTTGGPISATFNYAATFGNAYASYKYDTLTNTTSLSCQSATSDSGPLHYGTVSGWAGFGADSGGGGFGTTFSDLGRVNILNVPVQHITFNFVAPAGQPDLTAGAVSPVVATPGVPTTFSATVTNSGAGGTGAAFTDLFQRATDALGTGSTDIGTFANTALAAGGTKVATLSYTFPSAATWYMRVCADKSSSANLGVITESNEGNNCGAWTAIAVSYPAVTGTCSVAPTTGTTATSFIWTASGASGGNGGPYTYAWSGTNLTGHTGISYTVPAGSYAVGGPYSGSVTITDSVGNSSASIPCTNQITSVTAPPQPDLTAGNVSASPAPIAGQATTLSALISNSNVLGTGAGFTDLFQKANDALGTGAVDLAPTYANAALAASGSNTASISYTPPLAGTFYFRACADKSSMADANGVIAESNEANNCSGVWTAITVGAPPQPDLTAGNVSSNPNPPVAGQPTTLSALISNSPAAGTGIGFTDLFQKANDSSGTGAVDLAPTYANPALAAGGSNTASVSYTFPSATTYYFRACADKSSMADVNGVIVESNEGNNCSSAWTGITASAAPLPPSLSCSPSPSSGNVGDTITYTATPGGSWPGGITYTWTDPSATPPSKGPGVSNTYAVTYATSGAHAANVQGVSGATTVNAGCSIVNIGSTCGGSPTATITASAPRVIAGSTVHLTWSANNVVSSCTVTGPSFTQTITASSCTLTTSGSSPDPTVNTQSTYCIVCDGDQSTKQCVTVDVVPKIIEF